MKVLQIHKFHTKERGGGSVTSYFETAKYLKEQGHEVIFFSMTDPTNEKTKYEKYFAQGFDLSENMSMWKKIRLLPKTIYNREAMKKMEKLLIAQKPDIAHAHNIEHYLTPAIYKVLKKHHIPIVMTLHNYSVICPNYKLFVRGKICEQCKKTRYYKCFTNTCLKGSRAMSFVGMCDAYFNKIFKTYECVDLFLAPSHFLKEKCVEFGMDPQKIEVVRNNYTPINISTHEDLNEDGEYFLYFGRISDEKGIDQLINAVKKLYDTGKLKEKKLYIVGKGPEESTLRAQVERLQLEDVVQFLGFKKGDALTQIIEKSLFVVLPSIWYENAPFAVLEAQSLQKPVIVSDLGGSRELIDEGRSGLVYKSNDVEDLANKMTKLLDKTVQKRQEMGIYGKQKSEELIADSEKIIKIYQKLVKK